MDYLREGIGLRAYSQRDPLIEYQREGFDMFNTMMEGITEESVGFLFNVDVQVETTEGAAAEPSIKAKGIESEKPAQQLAYSAPSEDGEPEVHTETAADDDEANEKQRTANAKNKARQKAKAQRQSRKRNR